GVAHPPGVDPRQQDAERLSGPRPGEPVHVQPLVPGPPARPGPAALERPDPPGDRLEPEPGLVLGPHLDPLKRVPPAEPGQPPSQVFSPTAGGPPGRPPSGAAAGGPGG